MLLLLLPAGSKVPGPMPDAVPQFTEIHGTFGPAAPATAAAAQMAATSTAALLAGCSDAVPQVTEVHGLFTASAATAAEAQLAAGAGFGPAGVLAEGGLPPLPHGRGGGHGTSHPRGSMGGNAAGGGGGVASSRYPASRSQHHGSRHGHQGAVGSGYGPMHPPRSGSVDGAFHQQAEVCTRPNPLSGSQGGSPAPVLAAEQVQQGHHNAGQQQQERQEQLLVTSDGGFGASPEPRVSENPGYDHVLGAGVAGSVDLGGDNGDGGGGLVLSPQPSSSDWQGGSRIVDGNARVMAGGGGLVSALEGTGSLVLDTAGGGAGSAVGGQQDSLQDEGDVEGDNQGGAHQQQQHHHQREVHHQQQQQQDSHHHRGSQRTPSEGAGVLGRWAAKAMGRP